MLLFVACKLKLGLRLVIGKCFIFAKLCCLNYPFAACFLIFFKQNLLSISCRLQPIRIWIVKVKGNLAYHLTTIRASIGRFYTTWFRHPWFKTFRILSILLLSINAICKSVLPKSPNTKVHLPKKSPN